MYYDKAAESNSKSLNALRQGLVQPKHQIEKGERKKLRYTQRTLEIFIKTRIDDPSLN